MILMDGDGEDNPSDLPIIIKNVFEKKNVAPQTYMSLLLRAWSFSFTGRLFLYVLFVVT